MSDFLVVVAIDFGTTFSGYAFSYRSNYESIIMNKDWGQNLNFPSYKVHTSVLVNHKGEFEDFGFDAENTFANYIQEDDEEVAYHMFRFFKMILHRFETLSRTTMIKALDGGFEFPAMTVVSYALKYLKRHFLEAIGQTSVIQPSDKHIRWVITVPAIWSEESKQFMRQAAVMSGIIDTQDSDNLVIALEPEAASLCCRRTDIAHYPDGQTLSVEPGTRYLVIDCGGGTVDITAHEVLLDMNIREIHSASGVAWGGTRVDTNFIQLMRDVLGDRFIDEFKTRFPQQWLLFMIAFEKMKRSIRLDKKSSINIPMNYCMSEEYSKIMGEGNSISDAIKSVPRHLGVSFTSGTIRISHERAIRLFKPVIEEIIEHVQDLILKPELAGCKLFFMVGGFSESRLLQQMIRNRFEPQIQILIPWEAQMAVIKGAVIFGHRPQEIKSRKMKLAYGCEVLSQVVRPNYYDPDKIIMIGGDKICKDIFLTFVSKDEEIEEGDKREHTVYTVTEDQDKIKINLFSMDRMPEELEYTDGLGIRKVGEFIVETPGEGPDRPVHLVITFGGTEIKVKGQADGKPSRTTIKFMET